MVDPPMNGRPPQSKPTISSDQVKEISKAREQPQQPSDYREQVLLSRIGFSKVVPADALFLVRSA